MTLDAQVIASEAQLLRDAEDQRVPVMPLTERLPAITIGDAYRVQRQAIGGRVRAGDRVIGHKVGLTNRLMQELLGVDQPDYGVLLDGMVVAEAEGLLAADLIEPRAEAEIAFELGAPLRGADVDVDMVLAATVRVAPALEIIDSRIVDWRIAIQDTIADNASAARVVFGEWSPAKGVDMRVEEVTVTIGARTARGLGEAVLGHPAEAVAWLARTLAEHDEQLDAGDVVLPGAMAVALPFAAGDVIRADYSTLGSIEVAVG